MTMPTSSTNSLPPEYVALREAREEVGLYRGAAPIRAVIEFLRAIERNHLVALRSVSPQDLLALQGKLAQCEALRSVLEGDGFADGVA